MADLISREAALDAIGGMKPIPSSMEQLVMKSLCWAAVKTIQPVDAVPVVRCKDCVYYESVLSDDVNMCNRGLGWTAPDDYCSKGERRNDA